MSCSRSRRSRSRRRASLPSLSDHSVGKAFAHHAIWCARRGLCGEDSQRSPAKQGEAGSQHAGGAQAPNLRSGSRVHASAICPPHRLQRPPPQFSFALKKKARSRKLSSPCVLGDCLRGAGPSAISTSAEALPPPVRPHYKSWRVDSVSYLSTSVVS